MSIKKFSSLVSVLLLGLILTGCANIPGGVAASTTPINGRPYMSLGRAKHTSNMFALFGIFALTPPNSTRKAIDAAVRSRGGDAMIDVTVEFTTHYVVLFNRYMTTVEGEVIRFTGPVR